MRRALRSQALPLVPVLGLVLLAGAACGYRWGRPGAALPEGVRTVRAPLLENRTPEPGVEGFFTQALREELMRAGVDVSREEAAEAEVLGELLEVRVTPTIFSSCDVLATYRLFATARLRLVRQGRVLSEVVVTSQEDYLPGGVSSSLQPDGRCGPQTPPPESPVVVSERNRELALRHLAEVLMRDGYARLASGL